MHRTIPLLVLLAACNPDPGDTGDVPADDPLAVHVDDPSTGGFHAETSLSVTGTATGPSGFQALLNDAALSPADGAWSMDAGAPDGPVWPLLAHAEDGAGAWVRHRVTLTAGASTPAGDAVVDALVLRLTDIALASLRPELEQQIAELDLEEQLVTGAPVATILGSDVYIDRAVTDEQLLTELDFTASGLSWGIAMTGVEVDVRIESFLGASEGTITADRIDVTGLLVLGAAADGSLSVTATATAVETTNLVIEGLGSGMDTLVNTLLSDYLGAEVEKAIVDAMQDALAAQEAIRELSLGDATVRSDFTRAIHDEDGVNVYADSRVETAAGPVSGERLSNPGAAPVPTGFTSAGGVEYGGALLLDDDLLSAVGVGLVAGGSLEQELSGEVGGLTLDTTLLAGFIEAFEQLPADEPVTIRTRPTISPPATPGTATPEAARLHVGGLELDFAVGDDPEPVLTAVVDLVAGLEGGESLIDVKLVTSSATLVETTLDIPDPAEVEEPLAGMLGALLPGIVGDALAGAGSLDAVTVVDSGPAGPDGDRAALWLEVSLAPAE